MPIEIFCCYARKDQILLRKLKAHLMPLQREGLITVWADTNINAGAEWKLEIDKHLNTAQIILLLISPAFMLSDYCYGIEMKRAMERHECGEANVIPVILRSVSWQNAPFGKLQALPTNTKPATSWPDRNEAFFDVAEGLRKVVEELLASLELTKEQARQQEELAKEQARQQEELAKEQARQQEELAKEWVRQQRDLARHLRNVARERIKQRDDHISQTALPVSGEPCVVGIDLGTTNSCIALMEGTKPIVIPNAEGLRTTPSVVAFIGNGEYVVGEAAKQHSITNPENTIYSIKRFIGHRYNDPSIERDKHLVSYKVIPGNNGDAYVEVQGKQYSSIEISAMILQKLKADAEMFLCRPIRQAIITVPSYFNDSQRQATRDAAKIAGLETLRIINEPTAASLAYGLHKKKDERIAVYDMGGGTFNISILELGDGVFEVKCTTGDMHLGGEDFTQRIITWLADEFYKANDIDLRQERVALQRLKEAAERAKKELSTVTQTEINLPFITADANGPKHLNMLLSRLKLEQLVEDLINRSRNIVIKALSEASLLSSDINEVVLVGGQTRMPAVQLMVQNIFAREPHRGVSRDEVVAVGAAIQAGVLTGDVKDVLLLDVTSSSFGIETNEGLFSSVIGRNTTIPTQVSSIFSTFRVDDTKPAILMAPSLSSTDGKRVEIKVLRGRQPFAKDNHLLGRLFFDMSSISAFSESRIKVTFDIDDEGNLTVSVHDWTTIKQIKVAVLVMPLRFGKGVLDPVGIEAFGGIFVPILGDDITIPTNESRVFVVRQDRLPCPNASIIEVHVLQGEEALAQNNSSLGRFTLDGLSPAPLGVSPIEVTFDIDANGNLGVWACDIVSGKRRGLTIVPSSGLPGDQINRLIIDAKAHVLEDKRRIEEIEERNLAESASYLAEKAMIELGDKLTREQRSILYSQITELHTALTTNNMNRIKVSREELEQIFHEVSEEVYLRFFTNEEARANLSDVNKTISE